MSRVKKPKISNKKDLRKAIQKYEDITMMFNSLKKEREEYNQAIKGYFSKKKFNKIEIKDSYGETVRAVVSKSVPIIFNADEIHEDFDKEITEKFIEKEIVITDWESVVDLLKEHGVKPKEFMKSVIVKRTVNEKKLDKLYDIGEIDEEDLEGYYEYGEPVERLTLNIVNKDNDKED